MTFADPSVQRILDHLDGSSARLERNQALPALEAAFETLYALTREDPEVLQLLLHKLSGYGTNICGKAWLALFELRCASNGDAAPTQARLEAVRGAPHYTAVVVGTELARLVRASRGSAAAFAIVSELSLAARFEALDTLTEPQLEGPLLGPSCLTLLELAGGSGAFSILDTVARAGQKLWAGRPGQLFQIELASAEAELGRGEYTRALSRVDGKGAQFSAGARLHAACIELHARVSLGEGETDVCRAVLQRCLSLLETCNEDPLTDRDQLRKRISWLAATNRKLAAVVDGGAGIAPTTPPEACSVGDLFRLEATARRERKEKQRRELLEKLVSRAEHYLEDPAALAADEELRLRLLWCRLVMDLDLTDIFPFCESALTSTIERSRALGSRPLEMLARDQLGLLCARKTGDPGAALIHCQAAAEIALELLARNAGGGAEVSNYRRAYLEDLLPILDRALELQAQFALAIATLPELRAKAADPFDATLFDAQTPQGSWQRFGRSLQACAENVQALALDEARAARAAQVEQVARVPPQLSADTKPVLDQLRSQLRKQDAVLQYLLVGRYALVFAYGREFFLWHAGVATDQAAERTIEQWVRDLNPWISGELAANREVLANLQELLLPRELLRTLLQADITHIRIVPHGALYRLPFGRLETPLGPLGASFSTSLHPTGTAAARAAALRYPRPPRRASLARIVGPELVETVTPVACAEQDRRAIEQALGSVASPALVCTIDGSRQELVNVTAELPKHQLLHFLCHGQKGSALGTPASLLLAAGPRAELTALAIGALNLSGCKLVLLQSCWTGWLDHSRTNPVQGLPQAFADAGAHAVIAPLTQVPVALAPVFSTVFYRALRFLSAELALRRALLVLRTHGPRLLRHDAEASAAYAEWGSSYDALEYRYTGASDVVFGTWLSRLIGRLGFWWFERQLSK